ncbi:MAG: hypothetical protein SPF04_02910 [Bacilli bacterium]|nr:hypothetical protein [Candidatus Onthovivens sp.]MDY5058397.1 hypothetical protein [Bacilli bacterium]
MSKEEIKQKILELKTDEEIESFISLRIAELESIAQEKIVGQDHTITFNDYISSKVKFKPVASLKNKECPNLIYDDILPYFELIKELATNQSYLNELYLFTPLMFEIFNYMSSKENKDNIEDTLIERQLLYFNAMNTGKENISIKEFHKNKYAFCSENTGLAHNIFKILGIDSQFVIGKRNNENHAFNIIFPNGYGNSPAVLFDASYTIDFTNDLGNRYSLGYFKVLTPEEYSNMLSGNSTPINLQGSANNLIRYYPTLSNCTASLKDASYSIGLGDPLKIENSSNSSHIKKG